MNDKNVRMFVITGVLAIVGITFASKQILSRGTKVDFAPFTKVNHTMVENESEPSRVIPTSNKRAPASETKTKPSNQNTKTFTRNGYHELKVIDVKVSPIDAQGNAMERVTVAQTDFKYPLIRTVEKLQRDANGQTVVVDQKEMVADHMIVRVHPGVSQTDVELMASRLNAWVKSKMGAPDTYLIGFNGNHADDLKTKLQEISRDGLVSYADTDYVVYAEDVTPNDPYYNQLWNLENIGQDGGKTDKDIDAAAAWGVTKGSKSVKIGILDTGADYTHPDLAANIWCNPGETGLDANGNDKATNGIDDDGDGYIDDVHGFDFYNNDGDPMDDYFHGTHVAGTIAAVGNNGVGVAGVCWTATIIPLKFLNEYGGGVISDAVNAVYYATRMGVKLTSNSWSGGGFDQSLSDAITDAAAHNVMFVAAAGNDGLNIDSTANKTYPACYTNSNVVSVAATDNMGVLAPFSNYGYNNVDIAAPGVNILSTFPVTPTQAMNDYMLDPSYGYLSGTSMATPHVSGVLGLIFAKYPTCTVAQAIDRLKQRADHTTTLMTKVAYSATLNAYKAINPSYANVAASIQRVYTTMTDPEGNKNNVANPGETIQFKPTLMNLGNIAVSNAVIKVTCADSRVKVLTAPISMGTLTGITRKTVGSPLKVSLSTTFSNQTSVPMSFVVSNSTGFSKTLSFSVTVKP